MANGYFVSTPGLAAASILLLKNSRPHQANAVKLKLGKLLWRGRFSILCAWASCRGRWGRFHLVHQSCRYGLSSPQIMSIKPVTNCRDQNATATLKIANIEERRGSMIDRQHPSLILRFCSSCFFLEVQLGSGLAPETQCSILPSRRSTQHLSSWSQETS